MMGIVIILIFIYYFVNDVVFAQYYEFSNYVYIDLVIFYYVIEIINTSKLQLRLKETLTY